MDNSRIQDNTSALPSSARMKVWYLYHSGYAVRTRNCLLIFDYWKDEAAADTRTLADGVFDASVWLEQMVREASALSNASADRDTGIETSKEINSSMDTEMGLDNQENPGVLPTVVVFSSHKHGDHFNPQILEWQNTLPAIHYILSKDIPKRHFIGMPKGWVHEAGNPDEPLDDARILRVKAHETLVLPDLDMRIHTFRSTDAGVAFWVEVDGVVLYHAGDLNLWYWEEESKSWNNNMIARYKQELAVMKEWADITKKKPDAAFLPMDPRLGTHWLDGYRPFMAQIGADAVFPMHFGEPSALGALDTDLAGDPAALRQSLRRPDKRGASFLL